MLAFTLFGLGALLVQIAPALTLAVRATNGTGSGNGTIPTFNSPTSGQSSTLHTREIFYVGGQYVEEDGQHRYIDQMYVEQLTPAGGATQPFPLVFFHGGGASGTTWLNTPDGRIGWAAWFLKQGYQVHLIDYTGIARSGRQTKQPARDATSTEAAEAGFTHPEERRLYPQAVLHTQWPGTGKRGDPVFDAFYKSLVGIVTDFERQQYAMRKAGAELLDIIGPSILIAHSLGGYFPWLIADANPTKVRAIVQLEPISPPFEGLEGPEPVPARAYGLTSAAMTFDPPVRDPAVDLVTERVGVDNPSRRFCRLQKEPAKQLINLVDIPVLVVAGEASIHITYDHCTVDFLLQAGVKKTRYLVLADIGIKGNGHFSFLEKNSLDIAEVVNEWMVEQAKEAA